MTIKPNHNFKLAGTGIVLDKNKTYSAESATNQPEWKEKGKIFVNETGDDDYFGVLLEAGDYEIVTE